MSNLGGWPSDSVILALGWTLIHFLWQGALVGVLFASTRVLLRGVGPRVRYALACLALALMVVLPATSFLLKVSPSQPVGEQSVLSPERTQARTSPLATRINAATPGPQSSLSSRDRGTGLLDHSLPWIVLFWTMGVATLSIRMAGGWLYARRLKWEGTEEASPELKVTFRNLVKRVEVSRPVRFLLSTRVEVPMVIGWLRPFVIVPLSALAGLSPQQLEAILVHELAHIRRYDYLVNLLQTIVETLFFYHPAVWWISRQIRTERENCCDDWAVMVCGDARVYARALTQLEEQRRSTVLAVPASGGSLLTRVRRLLALPTRRRHSSGLAIAGMVVLAVGAITLSAHVFLLSNAASPEPLALQDPPQRPAQTTEWQKYIQELTTLPRDADDQRRELHEDFIRNHANDPNLSNVQGSHLNLLARIDPEEAVRLARNFLSDPDTNRPLRIMAYWSLLRSFTHMEDVGSARKLAQYILEHEDDHHTIAMASSYDLENRFSYLETAREKGASDQDLRYAHTALARALAEAGRYEEAAQHALEMIKADAMRLEATEEDRHRDIHASVLAHSHLTAAGYFAETNDPERGLLHAREAEQLHSNAELRHPEDPLRNRGPETIRGQILERLGWEEEALSSYLRSYARRADPAILARIESLSALVRKPVSDSLGRVEAIRQGRFTFKPFELRTLQGEIRRLRDFNARVLLISFFSPRCEPCLSEAPYLEELYWKYRGQGLEIVAINTIPELTDEVHTWKGRNSFPMLVGAGQEFLRENYNFPAGSETSASYVLLNEERRVMFRHNRQLSAEEGVLEAQVRQLLKPQGDRSSLAVGYEADLFPEEGSHSFTPLADCGLRSLDEGILNIQDNASRSVRSGVGNCSLYFRNDPLTSMDDAVMEFRARVNSAEAPNPPPSRSVMAGFLDGVKMIQLALSTEYVELFRTAASRVALDTTVFRTYRIEKHANVSVDIFVDEELLITVPYETLYNNPWPEAAPRQGFGAGSSLGTSDSDWDFVRYTISTVPSLNDG